MVTYCGKAHQRQDWPAHKAVCRPPAGSRGGEGGGEATTIDGERGRETGTTTTFTYSTVVNVAGPGDAPRCEEFNHDEVLEYLLRS